MCLSNIADSFYLKHFILMKTWLIFYVFYFYYYKYSGVCAQVPSYISSRETQKILF